MTTETPRKTAEEILALDDTVTDEVWVDEWQTFVKVRGLTKNQQVEVRKRSLVEGEADEEKAQANLFLEGVIEPQFTEDQMARVFEKNAGAVDTILKRVLALSGMAPEDLKKKEARFPDGQRPPVPVHTGPDTPQNGTGVAPREASPDIG